MVYILNVWPKSYLKWLSFLVWRKYEPAYKGTLVPRHRSTSCRTLRRQLPGLPSCNKWFNTLMINCAFLVARFVNLEVLCTYYVLEIQWAPTLLAAGDFEARLVRLMAAGAGAAPNRVLHQRLHQMSFVRAGAALWGCSGGATKRDSTCSSSDSTLPPSPPKRGLGLLWHGLQL